MVDKYNGVYPHAWSERDIAVYKQLGREPAKTTNGLWVTDVVREKKSLVDWSVAELYALALNELNTRYIVGDTEFFNAVRVKAMGVDNNANRWGEEELMEWLIHEKAPAMTVNGNYVNDPDRWFKLSSKWNDSELIDLGLGEFGELEEANFYILDEASTRFNLPQGITFEAYCDYIQNKTPFPLTSNGVLIDDRTRNKRQLSQWSDAELEAWLLDEIPGPDALLTIAIERFGGEWYWNKANLKEWVVYERIPVVEHNYSSYTDEQLQRLFAEEDDIGAKAELDERYPVVIEPTPEPFEVKLVFEPVDPASTVQVDEPVIEEVSEVIVDEKDIVDEEPVVGDAPVELHWQDLISDYPELIDLMQKDTPLSLIQDHTHLRVKTASKWTTEELVAWVRGEIPEQINTTPLSLSNALRSRFSDVMGRWSDDAIAGFIGEQKIPRGLDTGILYHDITRDSKYPGQWTDEELKAFMRGELYTLHGNDEVWAAIRSRFKLKSHLSEEEMRATVIDGVVIDKPIEPITTPETASDKQLQAWLNGKLSVSEELTDDLIVELRIRNKIDDEWTDADTLVYLKHGKLPERTEDGLLVHSRLRDLDDPSSWSIDELRAFSLGLLEANFSETDTVFIDAVRNAVSLVYQYDVKRWDDAEVINFLSKSVKPKFTTEGNLVNDPTRLCKVPSEWSRGELKDWLRKEISATEKASEDVLWDEVYLRFNIPMVWYSEDARKFVLTGDKVPATPSGIWYRDRDRDYRIARHWTKREIKAFCRGIILPGVAAREEDLIEYGRIVFGISFSLDDASVKRRIADITEESVTMTVKFVEEDLKSYEKGRLDAGTNDAKAAPYQSMLDRCISRVLKLQGEDFNQGWTELLKFFFKHSNTILSRRFMYVGVGQMQITAKNMRIFQAMTTLLANTCNAKMRDQALINIDWEVTLRDIPNEETRQKLMGYYHTR